MQNTGPSVAVVVVVVGDDRREGTGFLICKVIRQLLPRHPEEWCRPSLLCLLCRSHNVDDGPEQPIIDFVSALWRKRATSEQVSYTALYGRGFRCPSSHFSSSRRLRAASSVERTQWSSTLRTRSGCGSFKLVSRGFDAGRPTLCSSWSGSMTGFD